MGPDLPVPALVADTIVHLATELRIAQRPLLLAGGGQHPAALLVRLRGAEPGCGEPGLLQRGDLVLLQREQR